LELQSVASQDPDIRCDFNLLWLASAASCFLYENTAPLPTSGHFCPLERWPEGGGEIVSINEKFQKVKWAFSVVTEFVIIAEKNFVTHTAYNIQLVKI
jgi:hypothetical protein